MLAYDIYFLDIINFVYKMSSKGTKIPLASYGRGEARKSLWRLMAVERLLFKYLSR